MPKVTVGLRVDEELVERLRNAIWHLGRGLTVTSVTRHAIEEAVSVLERSNGGKPYPPRKPRKPSSGPVTNEPALPPTAAERASGALPRRRQHASADTKR